MPRVLLVSMAIILLYGCAEESRSPAPIDSDPTRVSRTFLEALVARDSDACDYMTESGREQFEVQTGESSCEAAVAARRRVLSLGCWHIRPADLLDAIDDGELSVEGQFQRFKLELPHKTTVTLRLADTEVGWQVNSVILGRTELVEVGEDIGEC